MRRRAGCSPSWSPPLRGEIEALPARAEQGEETHLEILERLTAKESHRQRFRELLRSQEVWLYEPLPGLPKEVPVSVRYVCPTEDCNFEWRPQQKGEKPPRCPRHDVDPVLASSQ
ncbi:MAG: hypothetical protein RMK32_04625 [Anaerolineae bacterium]|nr:hypothetical protein [Anaerolineae bacterium]